MNPRDPDPFLITARARRADLPAQRGAALITSLVLLLLLTVLGVTAVRNAANEERMAGNAENRGIALQAAEAGLRNGELWLSDQNAEVAGSGDGSSGAWRLNAPDPDANQSQLWWREASACWWTQCPAQTCASDSMVNTVPYGGQANNRGCTGQTLNSSLFAQPRYLIEYQAFVPDSLTLGNIRGPQTGRVVYRITSRGTGGTDSAVGLVQSTYRRVF